MVKYDDTDDRIREIVRSMALSKYKSFYLEHIKTLMPELTLEQIAQKLYPLRQNGTLILRYEIRCPESFTELGISFYQYMCANILIVCLTEDTRRILAERFT